MDEVWNTLTKAETAHAAEVEVAQGRTFRVEKQAGRVAELTYEELC